MARVPVEVTPDVAPAATPPSDYQRIDSSAANFGGLIGAAQQRTGAELDQTGNNLAQIAEVKQQRFNQVAGDDAMNNFMTQGDALTYGNPSDPTAPKGLYQLRGAEALTAGPGISSKLTELRDQIKNGLQNDYQKLQFDEQSRRYLQYKSAEISRHLDQQSDNYALSVNEAGINVAALHAGNTYNSDDALMHSLSDAQGFADKGVGVRYGANPDPALVDQARTAAHTKVVKSAIDGALAADPINGASRATQILTKFGGLIDPAYREQFSRQLHATNEELMVGAASQSIINGTPAPAQARGGAIASAYERLKTYEHGEDAQGNALVSSAGATGLTQMMPGTAQATAQKHGVPYHPEWLQPGTGYDHSYSDMLGRLHFGDLMQQYDGNVTLATAAYNAGSGRVDQWLGTIGDPRKGVISDAAFAAAIPINETRKYTIAVAQPSALPSVSGPVPASAPGGTQSGVQPAVQQVGQPAGAPAPGGQPTAHTHNPAAYDMEAQMLTDGWRKAQELFPNRPDLQQKMMAPIRQHIDEINLLEAKRDAATQKAQKDAQDGVMNDVITTLTNDPTKFDPSVINNPVLTPEQRENLDRFARARLAESGVEDTAPYGKGYAQAYNAIFAPQGDPSKINDLNDILKRGAPGGDLTGRGVQKLAQVFAASRKNPDELAINRTESSMLTYAKTRLSFEEDTGPVKIRDPKGEAIFNAQFVPKFEAGLAAAKASGDPAMVWKYLAQDNIDTMMKGMRNPAQMAHDRLTATGQLDEADVEKPGTPLPPVPTNIIPAGSDKPVQINPQGWNDTMGQLPVAASGQPYTHAAWAKALTLLLQHPDEKTIRQFDQYFGIQGFSGANIVQQLTGPRQGPLAAPMPSAGVFP